MIEVGGFKIAVVLFSANRPFQIPTLDWLNVPEVDLCIPESEVQEYVSARQPLNANVVAHPNEINRLFKKIKWVWDFYRGKCDAVVKIDDDIQCVRDNGMYHNTDTRIAERSELTSQEFFEVIQNLFVMARDLGTPIFGFGNVNRFYHYGSHDRFRFCTAFDASIMGYRFEDKVKLDESILCKNEYDLQLQSLFYYGKNLVDKRFRQVQFNMHGNMGGMATARNTETIEASKKILKNKWGGNIIFGKNSVRFKWE